MSATNQNDQRTLEFTQPAGSAQSATTTTPFRAGKYVVVSCTAAGAGVFTFADGTSMTVTFAVGTWCYPWSCTTYTASSGTMTVYILY